MPIDQYLARKRKHVVWLRVAPPDRAKQAFENRRFEVSTFTDEQLEDAERLSGVGAVVLSQEKGKAFQISRDLRRHVERLLDFDCVVIVQPAAPDYVEPVKGVSPPPDLRAIVIGALDDLRIAPAGLRKTAKMQKYGPKGAPASDPPSPHVRIFGDRDSWDDIANHIVDHPPGNAPALPELLRIIVRDDRGGMVSPLPTDQEILVRRAFWDCEEVCLVQIMEGHSGADVYRAYPKARSPQLKTNERWLLPYFVKIGERNKIFSEYENYIDDVEGFVPFHLGPHLVRERCGLGARNGILVGDWVEESESLSECARSGRAVTAIACLFDRTLQGWYRNASPEKRSVADILAHKFPRRAIARKRLDRIKSFGGKKSLKELEALFQRCNFGTALVGPIHGDLHAANVRVRAADAIVIDFYSHQDLPVLFDFACLEASLLVEGFDRGLSTDANAWFDSIQSLYDVPFSMAPENPIPHNMSRWFHVCVRQIRHQALRYELNDRQYAACLALAMLIKATKDQNVADPEATRRAAAYYFAERVLIGAFGGVSSSQAVAVC